jgi:hypothetical protein
MAKEQPDLKASIEGAKALTLEDVCVPIKSTTVGEMMRAPNPDGKTVDLLQWYYRAYAGPTTCFAVDTGTGEVKKIDFPDNLQIHICGKVVGKDGKLYITTPWWYRSERKGMELFVYDPATNTLTQKGVIAPKLGYENRPMVIGTNGRIYGASSYPDPAQAGAYEINTDTGETTDFGPIGPQYKGVGCWLSSVAADDRYIYVATRNEPKYITAFDRETRTSKVLVTAANIGGSTGVNQLRYGCEASAEKIVGPDGQTIEGAKQYWLYKGEAIEKKTAGEKPPWQEPAEQKPWVTWPTGLEVDNSLVDPGPDGTAEIWYRIGGQTPGPAPKPDATREELGWKVARYQVPTYPMNTHHIIDMPDGRIFGTAGAYQGNFIYDPAANKATHLGRIYLSQYSSLYHDGKVYLSGYPSSPLFIFDLAKPWTANKPVGPGGRVVGERDANSNPRLRINLREFAGTHEMTTCCVGADGRVYFGGTWIRDGSGGGFAWWDSKAQKGGGFWKELSPYRVTSIAPAMDGKQIVISTVAVNDTVLKKPTSEQGKLFVFDCATEKIVKEIEPFAKVKSTGMVAGAGGSRVIGMIADPGNKDASILYGVDVATGEVAFKKTIPFSVTARDFKPGPDGRVWTTIGGALVRISPADASVDVVGKGGSANFAFSGGDVYFSGTDALRRAKGVYKP